MVLRVFMFCRRKNPFMLDPGIIFPPVKQVKLTDESGKGEVYIPVKSYGKIDMLSFWDALISIGKVKMMRMLRWTTKSMI